MQKPYRKGVLAVIVDQEGKVLVIQKNSYRDNEWSFVGGGREGGEGVEENAFREIMEEIGLDRNDSELIGVSQHKMQYDWTPEIAAITHGGKYRGQLLDYVIVRFLGKRDAVKIQSEELRKHKWIEKDEIKDHLLFPGQYDSFLQVIQEFKVLFPG